MSSNNIGRILWNIPQELKLLFRKSLFSSSSSFLFTFLFLFKKGKGLTGAGPKPGKMVRGSIS